MQKSRYNILPEVSNAARHKNPVGTAGGFTLIELLLTVAVLAILAGIAIPRMDWGVIGKADARTSARAFANYLKLARSLAITNAGSNSKGYKVVLSRYEPYTYTLINAETSDVVKGPIDIPQGVERSGDRKFHFTPLGELKGNHELTLQLSSSGETTVVSVTPIGRITVAK